MSDLPSGVVAALRAPTLVAGVLVEADLPDGVVRAWSGAWELTTSDARVWSPVWQMGAISEIETGSALEAPTYALELRQPLKGLGVNLEAFRAAFVELVGADVFGRSVTIYLQVFAVSDLALVGAPVGVFAGLMTNVEGAWDSVASAVARVNVEHPLAFATGAAFAYLTDADQQARSPGDKACFLTTVLPTREVKWPAD